MNEVKKVSCNILLDVKKALQTLRIDPLEERPEFLYVTKTGAIKARWTLGLSTEETKKAYKYGFGFAPRLKFAEKT